MNSGAHIIGLVARDVMRLQVVSACFSALGVVEIAGDNAHGKTSVLRAMIGALGGKRLRPSEFVRLGEKEAEVVLQLDTGLRVELHVDAEGERLEVFDSDGVKQRRPQELLSELLGKGTMAYDPVAWMRWDREKQSELIRKIAGLDFSELDGERLSLYGERTSAGRELKAKEAQLAGHPTIPDGTPDEEISLAALAERQRQLQERKAANGKRRKEAETAKLTAQRERERVAESEARVRELEEELAAARLELESRKKTEAAATDHAAALKSAAAKLVDPDTGAVAAEIEAGEEINRLVRLKHARRALAQGANAATEKHAQLEARIAAIDRQKRDLIAAATFPVAGMGFDPEGFVTLNGLPIDQASGAEKIRAAVGIGIALNPELRSMWIQDGALLDAKQRHLLDEEVLRQRAQVFLELVVPTERTALILCDGMGSGPAVELALRGTAGKDAAR